MLKSLHEDSRFYTISWKRNSCELALAITLVLFSAFLENHKRGKSVLQLIQFGAIRWGFTGIFLNEWGTNRNIMGRATPKFVNFPFTLIRAESSWSFLFLLHRAIHWNLEVWSRIEIFLADVFTVLRLPHLHSFALIRHNCLLSSSLPPAVSHLCA